MEKFWRFQRNNFLRKAELYLSSRDSQLTVFTGSLRIRLGRFGCQVLADGPEKKHDHKFLR
jgi:hypothetical protein